MQLSIIIPCLNEANNISKVINDILTRLSTHKIKNELIIVDDGSTDKTYEVSLALKKRCHNIKIIKHPNNLGFGAAFWSGVSEAKGQYLMLIPGDGESKIDDLINSLPMLNEVDLIIPYVYNKINRSITRRVISKIFTLLINFIFRTTLNYTNGTVIYKSAIVKKVDLHSKDFFFQTELLLRLIKSGYLYCEIPVFLEKRSA